MICPVVIRFELPRVAGQPLILHPSVRTATSTLVAALNILGIDVDLQLGEASATFTPTSMRVTS